LIRDRGPIHNLGYGVTSRDLSFNEGETEGVSPNSGQLTKALDGHPVMRFFAHTGATIAVAGVMSAMMKKGGLKLAQKLQNSTTDFATSSVRTITDIRRHLDQLQGVKRFVEDGVDPYSKLVFETEEGLTTGYKGVNSESNRLYNLTKDEIRQAQRGPTHAPPALFTMQDEIQKRLVRAGRRLPYELPALYVTQRGLTDNLFGNNEDKKKVNWYNPVDVVSDFVKTSVTNLATTVLPFEILGSSSTATRSSLMNFKNSMGSLRSMSPGRQALSRNIVDLSEVLSEVGHDAASISNKFLKKSSQLSGGFNAAAEAFKEQPRFVQSLYDARHGPVIAADAARAKNSSSAQRAMAAVKAFAFGLDSPATIPGTNRTVQYGAFDAIPAFRGLSGAIKSGYKEFKMSGQAYDALQSSIKYNQIISDASMAVGTASRNSFEKSIQIIQSQHSSRLTRLAGQVSILGAGGPGDKNFQRSEFYTGGQTTAYKDLLAQRLRAKGVMGDDAIDDFVNQLRVNTPGRGSHSTNVISIGRSTIVADESEYYDIVLKKYKTLKHGKSFEQSLTTAAGGTSPQNFLKEIIDETNSQFLSKEFQLGMRNKINSQWNSFSRNDLVDIAGTVLKPQKAVYNEFVGPLSSAKQQFLQRKTAQVLGIKLKNDSGRMVSDDIIKRGLANRGFNPNDLVGLRSFLLEKRQISSGLFGGNYNIFGLKPLLIDEAIQQDRFRGLPSSQKRVISDLAGRMAINDPVSKSIGLNRLDGVYKTRSGNILDFSTIKNTFSNTASFFASEFHIPIIKLNPADLFGFRSFSDMARRGPLQYSPGRSVQPFGDLASSKADFHIWHSTGGFLGTKGKVTSFSVNSESGATFGKTLRGTYRPLPTNSTEMLTRHARYAAGLSGQAAYEVTGQSGSRFLDRVLNNSSNNQRAVKFKSRMAVDSEQPNSIFGLLSRFQKRNVDVNNPKILSKLLTGEEVTLKTDSISKKIRLNSGGGGVSFIDEAGAAVSGIEERQILTAMNDLRKNSFQYGLPRKVMKQLEDFDKSLFTFGPLNKGAANLTTQKEMFDFADEIEASLPMLKAQARQMGIDPRVIEQSFSNVRKLQRESNLLATSQLAGRSPTISTKMDEMRNEIFRFVSQTNAALTGNPALGGRQDDMFIAMQDVILKLKSQLPASEFAEAQAAALSTLFNTSAFLTYKRDAQLFDNARSAAGQLAQFATGKASGAVKSFFTPYTSGSASVISTNIKRPFSSFLPPFKKAFGTAPYKIGELSTDVLGSGQKVTFVPTFGTVFEKNPFGAIKSALGLTTYSDPSSYSTASTPISQGVERLNRYFGTLGMQLDVSKFKGPLDLYARGMVGKRVLPIYAAGTAAFTADRMLGGALGPEDNYGEKTYSPFVTTKVARGIVETQAIAAGLTPGGMTKEEKKEQLLDGEVPIRQGRYWPLGNTPFKGGKIQYYRPSWYRKLQGGALFTSDTYGSPAEKFLFNNDISPLRPLDPYRFERKHYEDRPYPITGEYFTGPFGPINTVLNATVGRVLKPQVAMHQQEVMQGLGQYVPAGQYGAYDASAYNAGMGGGSNVIPITRGAGGGPGGSYSSAMVSSQVGGSNANLRGAAQYPLNTARGMTRNSIAGLNQPLMQMSYGPPKQRGIMPPRVASAGQPIESDLSGEFGYRAQEMAGIYGFGFASLREKFGFGQGDFEPNKAMLQSASKGYGTSRAFWDLNLGGLGDVPIPAQGALGNIEFSEIVRRFIPKERTGIDYINPIANTMGKQYPFMPGPEYYINFQTGDPFTKVQEGEVRLPGRGYERFNRISADETGKYGLVDQFKILADVAPYSQQFKSLNSMMDKMALSPDQKIKVQEIRGRVEETTSKYDFTPYPDQKNTVGGSIGRMQRLGEYIAHRDTLFNTKFLNKRTATEDWERRNVYGATFPQWQRPFESFIEPMLNKATQRDPLTAAAALGVTGSFFGRTPKAKLFGSAVGTLVGGGVSAISQLSQKLTGQRYMPLQRKKELALEEYSDILTYTKNTRLASMAQQAGDSAAANQYRQTAKRTMYGADLYGMPIDMLKLAIPKRKREHFVEMLNAPAPERERILSTAGRLERRIYEAAWGMPVEEKPDLAEYFQRHQLPDLSWEGWHPNTNMDHVKVKIGQSMGLEMSQMGYYPQQIKEANLANPSYPVFDSSSARTDVLYRLRQIMSGAGVSGTVTPVMNPFGSNEISIAAGMR